MKTMLLLAALVAILLAEIVPAAPLPGRRVAVLPFKMNSEQDLSYLREGAAVALSSRMGRFYDWEIVPPPVVQQLLGAASSPSSDADARKAGRLLGADYILLGSVTVIGGGISVDSRLVAVAGERPSATFFAHAEDREALFSLLDHMTREIHSALAGQSPIPAAAQPPGAGRNADAPRTAEKPPADVGARATVAAPTKSSAPAAATDETAPSAARPIKTPRPAPAPQEPAASALHPASPDAPSPKLLAPATELATTPKGRSPGFTIQVAAMRSEAAANAILARLRERGYEARIEAADLKEKGRWLRLRVGVFPSRDAAEPTLERLKREGYAPMLFPLQSP